MDFEQVAPLADGGGGAPPTVHSRRRARLESE